MSPLKFRGRRKTGEKKKEKKSRKVAKSSIWSIGQNFDSKPIYFKRISYIIILFDSFFNPFIFVETLKCYENMK